MASLRVVASSVGELGMALGGQLGRCVRLRDSSKMLLRDSFLLTWLPPVPWELPPEVSLFYLFLKETERERERQQAGRGRERRRIGSSSRLRAVSTEPDAGPELTNRETLT